MSSRPAPRRWIVPAAPSIAVLAFADMSPGKDQEYFADGLTEELLNLLAKVPGLRVAARTSAFAFKGKNEDVAQIGQKLHVAHILEGSVRKAGDQIRITTQLINVSDGFHLWSETYDRRITDVFAVQDEIAKAVVSALKLQLLAAPGSKERRTTSAEAHDLYLKGLYLWNQRSPDALLRAADFFREAIRADPGYALAYVGLADAIQVRTGYAWIRSSELGAQAKAAALHALELDPDLGEAHASLGIMLTNEFDWPAALGGPLHLSHRPCLDRTAPGGGAGGPGAGELLEEGVRPGHDHGLGLGGAGRQGQDLRRPPARLPGAGRRLGRLREGGPPLRRAAVRPALRRDPRLPEPTVNGLQNLPAPPPRRAASCY